MVSTTPVVRRTFLNFFDKVRREIVYKLMEEAGIPEGVLHAYRDFQEGLQVGNTIAGGLGAGILEANLDTARRPHVDDDHIPLA